MRKTLIIVIIVLLVVLFGYMLFTNTTIGGLTVYGVTGLNDKNNKLDGKIQTLSKMSTTEYQDALMNVSNSAKDYTAAKKSYEEMLEISLEDKTKSASQLEKYEIEYLWTRIGNHAKDRDLQLIIDVKTNSTSEATGYYNLEFAAKGSYVGITDFIYDVENDSSLGFKIEGFHMVPEVGTEVLKATFICRDIAINIDMEHVTSYSTGTTDENDNTNTTTDNTNATTDNTNTTGNAATNTTENSGTDAANAAQNTINDNFSIRSEE